MDAGHSDYWSVILDIKTLDKLVDRFKTDHDLLHTAMRSSYYLGMIPLLCEYFNMQLKDEGMRELNEIENGEPLNIFLSAEQPTWMSLFDRRCSLDQDKYTFWWSDIDREKLNQLMLKKVAMAYKKRDT